MARWLDGWILTSFYFCVLFCLDRALTRSYSYEVLMIALKWPGIFPQLSILTNVRLRWRSAKMVGCSNRSKWYTNTSLASCCNCRSATQRGVKLVACIVDSRGWEKVAWPHHHHQHHHHHYSSDILSCSPWRLRLKKRMHVDIANWSFALH